jgi:MFS family permease
MSERQRSQVGGNETQAGAGEEPRTGERVRPRPSEVPAAGAVAREGRGSVPEPQFTEITPGRVRYASIVAFVAWVFAVYDYITFGTLLPKISDTFNWSTSFSTAVATYVAIATFVAAITVGPIIDYLGRKKAMVVTTAAAAISSGLSALTPSTLYLILVRTLSGFGYSEQAVNTTYLNELYGKREGRGFIYSVVQSGWPVGALLSSGMAAILVPLVGWRGTFLVATFPAIVILILATRLIESPVYERTRYANKLRKAGRQEEALAFARRNGVNLQRSEGITFRQLLERRYIRHTLFLAGAFLLNWIGIQVFDVLGTTVLTKGTGLSFSSSLVLLLLANLVAAAGYLSHGLMGDRFGRRNVTAFGWVMAGIAFTIMLFGPHVMGFTLAFYAIGLFFVLGTYASLFFYIGESYPTRMRGTAAAALNAMGPIGAIVGSALLTAVQNAGADMQVAATVVGALAIVLSGFCILGARNIHHDDPPMDELDEQWHREGAPAAA